MAKRNNRHDPFMTVLNHAADRLYLRPVWLGDELLRDPATALYTLSDVPETYGELRAGLNDAQRLKALNNLLSAARAYINAERKLRTHAVRQGELKLRKAKLQDK